MTGVKIVCRCDTLYYTLISGMKYKTTVAVMFVSIVSTNMLPVSKFAVLL